MREKHQSAKEYANTAHSQQQHEQRQQTHTTFTNGSQVTYTQGMLVATCNRIFVPKKNCKLICTWFTTSW